MGRVENGIARWGAIGCALAAAAYVLFKGFQGADYELDFRFVWLAGRAWALGIDPYGPGFATLAHRLFPTGNAAEYWLYPPQWWLPCRALALFSPARALTIWRLANAGMAFLGALLIGASVRRAAPRLPRRAILLFPLYPCLMYAVPLALSYGQTSIVVLFGLCLFVHAWLAEREWAMVTALVLCCLKPQFGGPLCVALLVQRAWWRAVVIAGIMSLLLALPPLLIFGVRDTIANFLANLGRHADLPPNLPPNMTGVSWLLDRVGLYASPTVLTLILAILLAAVVIARRGADDPRGRAITLALLCAASAFVLPLHPYDMAALVPALLMLPLLDRAAAGGMAVAAAILFRPAKLAAMFGPLPLMASGATVREIALETLALLIALLAASWSWIAERRAP